MYLAYGRSHHIFLQMKDLLGDTNAHGGRSHDMKLLNIEYLAVENSGHRDPPTITITYIKKVLNIDNGNEYR